MFFFSLHPENVRKLKVKKHSTHTHRRRPRRPPLRRVESVGMGVTSSMRPILMPARARARSADWAPGPGVLVLLPPVARSLTWRAVMPSSCGSGVGVVSRRCARGVERFLALRAPASHASAAPPQLEARDTGCRASREGCKEAGEDAEACACNKRRSEVPTSRSAPLRRPSLLTPATAVRSRARAVGARSALNTRRREGARARCKRGPPLAFDRRPPLDWGGAVAGGGAGRAARAFRLRSRPPACAAEYRVRACVALGLGAQRRGGGTPPDRSRPRRIAARLPLPSLPLLLAHLDPHRHVLRRQHGRIRRRLVAVGFDLHAAGDAAQRFLARQVRHVHKCVVERRKDVGHAHGAAFARAVGEGGDFFLGLGGGFRGHGCGVGLATKEKKTSSEV